MSKNTSIFKMLGIAAAMMLCVSACGNSNTPAASASVSNDSSIASTESIENSSSPAANSESSSQDNSTASSIAAPAPSNQKFGTFNKNVSLDETVMVDEDGVKITATGLKYTNYSVELELTIENNSGKNLSINCNTLGYSCNSINGYMVNESYLNCDVANGKKANDTISFRYDALMLYGIYEIADMEIAFSISDDAYNYTYLAPRQIKTSAFNTHDYENDCYQEAITSSTAMNAYEYNITQFSQDALYDEDGVKLLSSGVMINRSGETILLLEFINTTNSLIQVVTSDIALNGLVIDTATWSIDGLSPGKRGIIDVAISSVLKPEYWDIYGIKEVASVSLSLSQRDSEGNDITDKTPIEIVVPDAQAEYDTTGKEIYNNGGLRIVAKTILEDPSEYSSDMYVLLLAENRSGKTLSIDDVYDSLSVNGFMTDYSYDERELADGTCAALIIKLWGSSLEKSKIASAADIKEVEVEFEIKEGRKTIDKPVIKISFEE